MERKIEYNVFFWLVLLMFAAGYLNSSSMVLYSYSISHHTGNMTQVAINLYKDNLFQASSLIVIILFFFLGGVVSGFILYKHHMRFSKGFGTVLIADGALLFITNYLTRDIFIRCMTIAFYTAPSY